MRSSIVLTLLVRLGAFAVMVSDAQVAAAPGDDVDITSAASSTTTGAPNRTTRLVTGCGRGGTHSTAAALTQLGVNATHEDYSNDGVVVGWPYAAAVTVGEDFRSVRPLKRGLRQDYRGPLVGCFLWESTIGCKERRATLKMFSPVVLLVRHPLDVISSTRRCFCATGDRGTRHNIRADDLSWSFVEHNLNLTHILESACTPAWLFLLRLFGSRGPCWSVGPRGGSTGCRG
jgi:hypothetical protein